MIASFAVAEVALTSAWGEVPLASSWGEAGDAVAPRAASESVAAPADRGRCLGPCRGVSCGSRALRLVSGGNGEGVVWGTGSEVWCERRWRCAGLVRCVVV